MTIFIVLRNDTINATVDGVITDRRYVRRNPTKFHMAMFPERSVPTILSQWVVAKQAPGWRITKKKRANSKQKFKALILQYVVENEKDDGFTRLRSEVVRERLLNGDHDQILKDLRYINKYDPMLGKHVIQQLEKFLPYKFVFDTAQLMSQADSNRSVEVCLSAVSKSGRGLVLCVWQQVSFSDLNAATLFKLSLRL